MERTSFQDRCEYNQETENCSEKVFENDNQISHLEYGVLEPQDLS